MTRQLTIRSDEAVDTAQRLADRLGLAPAQVVVDALRSYDRQVGNVADKGRRRSMTPAQIAAHREELDRMIEEANRDRPPDVTSDHSFLYDEFGLPK